MNSVVYDRPEYVPDRLDWNRSLESMRDGQEFTHVLETLDSSQDHIVVRDWENGESRDALRYIDDIADVGAMMDENNIEYKLLSDNIEYTNNILLKEIQPSCWEPYSTIKNPYPYWTPTDVKGWKARIVDYWLEILRIYDEGFQSLVETETGGTSLESVKDALKKKNVLNLFKQTSPTLLSCLPWHLLGRDEWEKFPEFPRQILEKIVLPETTRLLEQCDKRDEIIRLNETVTGFIESIKIRDQPK